MKATVVKAWDSVLTSYWFIPTMMALGAIALAVSLTIFDARIGSEWLEFVPWLRANQPEGARQVLATIAGSMITVAGVAFSITIAAVSYASTQFGPRIITSFMRDRGNQITLGTFIATFLYCLTVLRTVWSPGEPPPDVTVDAIPQAFVPHVAMLGAFLFGVASVGVLIYFVHHVPQSFHVSSIVAGIGRRLGHRIAGLAEEAEGRERALPARSEVEEYDGFDPAAARVVRSRESGYVHNVDWNGLLETAARRGLRVHWLAVPGNFLREGEALALVWEDVGGAETEGSTGKEEGAEQPGVDDHGLRSYVALGHIRTEAQDVLFLIDELVEIAARALSPGVNDPFTAVSCIDWLTAGILPLRGRNLPTPPARDAEGTLRVLISTMGTSQLVERVFGQLRSYVAPDRIAAVHLMAALGTLHNAAVTGRERDLIVEQARELMEAAEVAMRQPSDLEALRRRYGVVRRLHEEPDRRAELLRRHSWLGTA